MVSAEPKLTDLVNAEEQDYISMIDKIKSLANEVVESQDRQRRRRHLIAKKRIQKFDEIVPRVEALL